MADPRRRAERLWRHGMAFLSSSGHTYAEAALRFQAASDLGHENAMLALAYLHLHGHGVEQDDEAAIRLYRDAVARGSDAAISMVAALDVTIFRNRIDLPELKMRVDPLATLRDTLANAKELVEHETRAKTHYRFRRVLKRKNKTLRPGYAFAEADMDRPLMAHRIRTRPFLYLEQHDDETFPDTSFTVLDAANLPRSALASPPGDHRLVQMRLWTGTHPATIGDFDLHHEMTIGDLRAFVAERVGLPPDGFVLAEEETEEIITILRNDDATIAGSGIITGDVINVEPVEIEFHLDAAGHCVNTRIAEYHATKRRLLKQEQTLAARKHRVGCLVASYRAQIRIVPADVPVHRVRLAEAELQSVTDDLMRVRAALERLAPMVGRRTKAAGKRTPLEEGGAAKRPRRPAA